MEAPSGASTDPPTVKLPKNSKGNRYYYKNREAILEKKRLARLAKLAETKEGNPKPIDERRLKKMEHLGLLDPKIIPGQENNFQTKA